MLLLLLNNRLDLRKGNFRKIVFEFEMKNKTTFILIRQRLNNIQLRLKRGLIWL